MIHGLQPADGSGEGVQVPLQVQVALGQSRTPSRINAGDSADHFLNGESRADETRGASDH